MKSTDNLESVFLKIKKSKKIFSKKNFDWEDQKGQKECEDFWIGLIVGGLEAIAR